MSSHWQTTNASTASQNVAGLVAISGGSTANAAIRCRSLQVTCFGTGVPSATLVVRDGATGAGAIIFQASLAALTAQVAGFTSTDLDLRATSGTMTIETTGSAGATITTLINAQGDYTVVGRAFGEP